MCSVSVRSENWKLNLFINFKFPDVYGKEGKMRVQPEKYVERYIKVMFGVVFHNLSYKIDVVKIEEEDL